MNWIQKNQNEIIIGIFSSSLVVLLQTFSKVASMFIYDLATRRLSTKKVWGISNPAQIYLVSGSIETLTGPTGLAYLAAPDAEAVAVASVALRLMFPRAELIHAYSPSFSPDLYGADIVSIGGPINNSCTRTLLKETEVPLKFEGLDLVSPGGRYELTPATPAEPVNNDYGVIVAAPNPFAPGKRCVLIAGCDTHGVLAAANALSPIRAQRGYRRIIGRKHGVLHWLRRYRYYAIVETKAMANTIGMPKVSEVGRL